MSGEEFLDIPKTDETQQIDVSENAPQKINKIRQPKKKVLAINEDLPIVSEEQNIET